MLRRAVAIGLPLPSNSSTRAIASNALASVGERRRIPSNDNRASGALYFSRNSSPARSCASKLPESAAVARSNAANAERTACALPTPSST